MLTDEQYGHQLGDRLRQETEDVHAGPDLKRKLRRRLARRTWAIRTSIAIPVAAAAAAAVVMTMGGQGATGGASQPNNAAQPTNNSSSAQVENVAYVKEQTLKALSQASQYVIYAKSTHEDGYYETWTDKATLRSRDDIYTTLVDATVPGTGTSPGTPGPMHLQQSHSISGPDDDQTIVTVAYERKAWWTKHFDTKLQLDEPDLIDPDSVRKAISDGALELVGKEKLNDLDTLHLRLYGQQRVYRIDMWVDSTSYLPVRQIFVKGTGETGNQEFPAERMMTTSYSWLPRTEENLARLVLTPPPGFQKVG